MRKFVISAALAASALTAAAPAAAQYYQPAPQGYNNQGNAYGHYNNYGQVRRLQARVDQLQRQIRHLDNRDILSEREAARLMQDGRQIEARLRNAARGTLTPWERQDVERRIYRLETRIQREARDGNNYRRGNNGDRWGQNDGNYRDGQFIDRDRDGRDDRHEDDGGRRRD